MAALPRLRRRVLVCRAQARRVTPDGVEILPVASFLEELREDRLWPR